MVEKMLSIECRTVGKLDTPLEQVLIPTLYFNIAALMITVAWSTRNAHDGVRLPDAARKDLTLMKIVCILLLFDIHHWWMKSIANVDTHSGA